MQTPEQIQRNQRTFINLLAETKRPGMDNLICWLLKESDFFKAPASTRYHLSEDGGLLQHSLNVYKALKYTAVMYRHLSGDTLPEETVIIVSLLHDICKANTYKKAKKTRKDAQGKWETYEGYDFNEDEPFGHGEKSVFILQRCGLQLTEREIYMIRWHMGAFDAQGNHLKTLTAAMAKHPEIALIHSADLIASSILENEETDEAKCQ